MIKAGLLLDRRARWSLTRARNIGRPWFDPAMDEVQLLQAREPGAIDLLDLAAAQTLLNSGTVHALQPEEMPRDSTIAALFRYGQTNRIRVAV
ncbi:MAG: hypothetical protein ACLQPD_04270 [Desulfomonilaceae bacterium]